MEAKRNDNTQLLTTLAQGTPQQRDEAMESIRGLEDTSLIQGLIDLVRSPESDEDTLRRALVLLEDVKYSELVPILGEAISQESQPDRLAYLLSVAWQNRMNFAPLIPQLVACLPHPHLPVVIEAITALEMALGWANVETIRLALAALKALRNDKLPQHSACLVDEMYSTASTLLQQALNAEREAKQ